MANEYPKINTLFLRDDNGLIVPDSFTSPEFEYLQNNKWECTEKIDGTNIHADITWSIVNSEDGQQTLKPSVTIHGRTSKAIIPQHLLAKLQEIFLNADYNDIFQNITDKYYESDDQIPAVSIYGEGYGKKIQKSGNGYKKDDVGFILFDVKVSKWWLNRESCENIAEQLNVPIVPIIGYMTITEAMKYVHNGFKSTIAENKDLDAEGLVLKTPTGLLFRDGKRIITKLKTSDFRKYEAKYNKSVF